jgi:uncharacterized protein (DUF58 family)
MNVTARMNSPYIKVFEEERELTVVLRGCCGSRCFGTRKNQKDLLAEVAAGASFSASKIMTKYGLGLQ